MDQRLSSKRPHLNSVNATEMFEINVRYYKEHFSGLVKNTSTFVVFLIATEVKTKQISLQNLEFPMLFPLNARIIRKIPSSSFADSTQI